MSAALSGWRPGSAGQLAIVQASLGHLLATTQPRQPLHVLERFADGARGLALGGELIETEQAEYGLIGHLPALYPEWLGDRSFCERHNTRFAYVTGAMANGIATPRLVIAMGRAQMLGFFGAAGLSFDKVERGLQVMTEYLAVCK